jgi:hypothetical protein
VTPARLVTALVTERGVCAASAAGLASLFPERLSGLGDQLRTFGGVAHARGVFTTLQTLRRMSGLRGVGVCCVISVVIACLNGAGHASRSLDEPDGADHDGPLGDPLADNGSTDASRAIFAEARTPHDPTSRCGSWMRPRGQVLSR